MRKKVTIIFITACLCLALLSFQMAKEADKGSDTAVLYPEGYRKWTHIKSNFIGPKSTWYAVNGGFNHIYANEKALKGYETGNFPEGSIVVFDVITTREDSINFVVMEVKRKRIDVMIKDSTRYAATGGWGYGRFNDHKENIITPELATKCFNCHAAQKDFVFSEFKD